MQPLQVMCYVWIFSSPIICCVHVQKASSICTAVSWGLKTGAKKQNPLYQTTKFVFAENEYIVKSYHEKSIGVKLKLPQILFTYL